MSFVTLEQQTLAVFTELTDEEVNGIVGGGGADVAVGVKAPTKVKIDGTVVNVQQATQVGTAVVIGEGKASVKQDVTQKIIQPKRR